MARAGGNMYRKSGEIRTCGFCYMQADRQTDRQTDKHANHNTSQPDRGRSNYNLLSMQTLLYLPVKKLKASHTRYRALGLELMTVYRQSARS